ncbi:hypothetical protein [Caulobacter sp. B11]
MLHIDLLGLIAGEGQVQPGDVAGVAPGLDLGLQEIVMGDGALAED